MAASVTDIVACQETVSMSGVFGYLDVITEEEPDGDDVRAHTMKMDFAQVAWLVDNLDLAMERWRFSAGASPFDVLSRSRVIDARYRGTALPALNLRLAFAQLGAMQLELIE